MTEPTLHLAVALDGAGWHPAAWREPGARPAELFTAGYWADLVAGGRARPARLRHHRGRARPAVRAPVPARRAHRPGPRPARRGADRGPGRPADPAHRAGADGDRHPHRAVPPLQGDRHPRLRQHRPGRACGSGSPAGADEAAHFGRRTIPAGRRPGRRRRPGALSPSCSTRPPTTSRWSAGCGTAGRTTPRSATSPPAASSTATSCTTSTSRARSSRVKGPSITPRPPQGQPLVTALGPLGRSPYRLRRPLRRRRLRHPARRRPTPPRSSPRSAPSRPPRDARDEPAARLRRPGGVPRRRPRRRPRTGEARLDELAGADVHQRRRDLHRHPGRAGRPAAGVAARPG